MLPSKKKIILKENKKPTEKGMEIELPSHIKTLRELKHCIGTYFEDEYEMDWDLILFYSSEGLEISDNDVCFLQDNDILYADFKGKSFDFHTILYQYENVKKLGEGGFGSVILGKHFQTGDLVAIKYVDISSQMSESQKIGEIYKEGLALKKLNHPNIIKLHHSFIHKKHMILIMECAGGGSLVDYMQKEGALTELESRNIFSQIADAINYCHKRFIIHRDMKLDNILFANSEKKRIQLVDFGICGSTYGKDQDKSDAGSVDYMAPEILSGTSTAADPTIDIWSLGVILYTLLCGSFPFEGSIPKVLEAKIRYDKDVHISNEVQNLIEGTLKKNPEERFTLEQINTHPWFYLTEEAIVEQNRISEEKRKVELDKEKERMLHFEEYKLQLEKNKNKSGKKIGKGMSPVRGSKIKPTRISLFKDGQKKKKWEGPGSASSESKSPVMKEKKGFLSHKKKSSYGTNPFKK